MTHELTPARLERHGVQAGRAAVALAFAFALSLLQATPVWAQETGQQMIPQAKPRAPVDTLAELGRALRACWQPPGDSPGSVITFRFGLDLSGRLKGKPLVAYARLTGDGAAQKRFVAAAIAALDACTPVRLSDAFAPIAASRVLTLTFAAPERARPQVPI